MLKTLLSFGTGDLWKGVSIMLSALLITFGLFAFSEVVSLHNTIDKKETIIKDYSDALTKKEAYIKELQSTVALKKTELEVQNKLIESNRIDFETKLTEATKAKAHIKEQYKVIYKWVNTYKGDENATSCTHARHFFNSVTW